MVRDDLRPSSFSSQLSNRAGCRLSSSSLHFSSGLADLTGRKLEWPCMWHTSRRGQKCWCHRRLSWDYECRRLWGRELWWTLTLASMSWSLLICIPTFPSSIFCFLKQQWTEISVEGGLLAAESSAEIPSLRLKCNNITIVFLPLPVLQRSQTLHDTRSISNSNAELFHNLAGYYSKKVASDLAVKLVNNLVSYLVAEEQCMLSSAPNPRKVLRWFHQLQWEALDGLSDAEDVYRGTIKHWRL